MPKSPLIRIAGAALLATFAFGAPAAAQGSADAVKAQPAARPTWDVLEHSRWIADGRDDAPRKIYVFMDANCKFCTKFWSDARPWVDSGQVQLRHLMVAVIAPSSAGKAAAILADADPARRLFTFEKAHAFGIVRMMSGGPHASLDDANLRPLDTIPPAARRELVDNDRMMQAFGIQGTPGIVFRGLDGQLVARPGLRPDELRQVFGAL
jgi:thiol:disulfide interchange protein DsbG